MHRKQNLAYYLLAPHLLISIKTLRSGTVNHLQVKFNFQYVYNKMSVEQSHFLLLTVIQTISVSMTTVDVQRRIFNSKVVRSSLGLDICNPFGVKNVNTPPPFQFVIYAQKMCHY